MIFVKHIPTFIDTDRVETPWRFDTLAELLANPWFDSWVADPTFFRFSLADRDTLMLERNEGRWWWVLGFLREGDPQSLGLPKWEPNRGRDQDPPSRQVRRRLEREQ